MPNINNHKIIPLLAQTTLLVVDAGLAGCVAALAATLQQKFSVMLVERYGFAGGTSTQILDMFYKFFTPGEHSRKIIGD